MNDMTLTPEMKVPAAGAKGTSLDGNLMTPYEQAMNSGFGESTGKTPAVDVVAERWEDAGFCDPRTPRNAGLTIDGANREQIDLIKQFSR